MRFLHLVSVKIFTSNREFLLPVSITAIAVHITWFGVHSEYVFLAFLLKKNVA